MRSGWITITWLFVGSISGFAQQSGRGQPDAVFYNGKVITVDKNFSIQQAFAIKGEQFIAVGNNATVRAMAGKSTRVVDLKGHAVIPGLTDDHDHVYDSAKVLLRGVNVAGVTSRSELLDRIRQAVEKAKPGETVFTSAGSRVQPPIAKSDLDPISETVPIVLVRGRRGNALFNTAALKVAGITRENPTFAGVPVPKDANGEPTGQTPVYPAGLSLIDTVLPHMTDAEEEDLILKAQQQRNAFGLTSVRDLSLFPAAMRVYYRLWRQGKLTIRVSMGLDLPYSDVAKTKEALDTWGVGSQFGDNLLRLDSISEDPDASDNGLTPEQLKDVAIEINRHGWRMAPHTEAEKDFEATVAAYEAADRDSSIHDKRWVLEHIPFATPSQMDRIAKLGVVVSAQYQGYNGNIEAAARTVGKERAEKEPPMRDFLDHHLIVSTGSDYLGAEETDNPLIPFYFYVTRKRKDGTVVGPEEKIGREEALRVGTINYAYTTFEDKVKGSLEPGKLADFLILSDDILTVPDDKILSIHPLATYLGGREVFSMQASGF
jgi:predicted amidohydrolase YtcJ